MILLGKKSTDSILKACLIFPRKQNYTFNAYFLLSPVKSCFLEKSLSIYFDENKKKMKKLILYIAVQNCFLRFLFCLKDTKVRGHQVF